MCGGEIYFRAIGRPWGPAADVAIKFRPLTAVATGGRPGPTASGRSHSRIQVRVYPGPPSAGPPPEPGRPLELSVCPTVRLGQSVTVCLPLVAGLPACAPCTKRLLLGFLIKIRENFQCGPYLKSLIHCGPSESNKCTIYICP
jgi:hypothetical protein